MSRILTTAKATTQGRKKQKRTLTTADLLIENGLGKLLNGSGSRNHSSYWNTADLFRMMAILNGAQSDYAGS